MKRNASGKKNRDKTRRDKFTTAGKNTDAKPRKAINYKKGQAYRIKLIQTWANEAHIHLKFVKTLGKESIYAGTGSWETFNVSVDRDGRIFCDFGEMEDGYVMNKQMFMKMVAEHKAYIAKTKNDKKIAD
jgi:hypothetical protein